MKKSVFDPNSQETSISSKVVLGLERLSEVFKVLLWDKAKVVGLSPIQIQILIFIAFHKPELCNVSHLAKEFNVTKPTISDAIKVLDKKKLILKDYSLSDGRSYIIALSESGKRVASETSNFAAPLQKQLNHFPESELEDFFGTLGKLIHQLNRSDILQVQRTCYRCRFYEKQQEHAYCNLLKKRLASKEIRLDCSEFQDKIV